MDVLDAIINHVLGEIRVLKGAPVAFIVSRSATWALGLVSVICGGCFQSSPHVTQTFTVTGAKAYSLDCAGSSWVACQTAAGNFCGSNGYKVINQTPDADRKRSMMITCNAAEQEIRAQLTADLTRYCPAKSDPASTAAREFAIRDAAAAVRSEDHKEPYEVAHICCQSAEILAKYKEPLNDRDLEIVMCEDEFAPSSQ